MRTKKHIGYLGPEGTFSEQAVKEVFKDSESFGFNRYDTIQDCLFAVERKMLDYAVVPIENSNGGSVNITIDCLVHEINVPIQGDIQLPISYELLADGPQMNKVSYDVIYGHPQALKQCDHYLRRCFEDVELQPTASSSMAAQIVAESPDRPSLAIANTSTKQIYGLTAIDRGIEDSAENMTRFIVLGDEAIDLPSGKTKSTMVVSFPENDLRVLGKVLGVLEALSIEPIKIESVPLKKNLGEYVFIIDVDTTDQCKAYKQACDDIRALNCRIRHLGSYPFVMVG